MTAMQMQPNQFPFILRTSAAIWIRLSHASFPRGSRRLSNASIICSKARDNLAKVRIILGRERVLECPVPETQGLRMSRRPIR